MADEEQINDIVKEMGESTNRVGFGNLAGEVWTTLYFKKPMTQDELKRELKASASAISQALTPLEIMGFIRVSGKDGRKRVYEAETSMRNVKQKFLEMKLKYCIEPMLFVLNEKKKSVKGKENLEKINNMMSACSKFEKGVKLMLALPIWKKENQ